MAAAMSALAVSYPLEPAVRYPALRHAAVLLSATFYAASPFVSGWSHEIACVGCLIMFPGYALARFLLVFHDKKSRKSVVGSEEKGSSR